MSRGLWYAFGAAVLFGVSGVVAADAFTAVDPLRVAQIRSVMAALVLGAWAYRRRQTMTGGRLPLLGLFGSMLAAVTVTYYWAIDRLGVGPGVTLQFLGPTLVLVWMRLVQRRRVPGAAWAAALTAVAGTALMTEAWNLESLDLAGVAAGLGAAVTFAGYLITGEHLGRRLPGLTITAYGFAIAAVILVLVIPPAIPRVGAVVWAQLAWIGLAGTVAPFFLEVAALRLADPGRVGIVATTEPVVAAVTAWIVLAQALSAPQVVGGLLVVAAIATIQALTHSVTPDAPTAQAV